MAEKDSKKHKMVEEPEADKKELEKVANEAAEKIHVKREKKLKPDESTIADIAKEKSDESPDNSKTDKKESKIKKDSDSETVAQFSTDLSKDPVKDDEETEGDEEPKQQPNIKIEDESFPEIPEELRVDGLLKKPKDTKKYKIIIVSSVVGVAIGLGVIYLLRVLNVL